MKKAAKGGLCEFGFVVVVTAMLLPMALPGNMAAQNDWDIWHNEEHVSNGGYCSILKDSGDNHIEGTFEWLSGSDPGILFEYTYDPAVAWYGAPATWSSPYYVFDFYTSWEHDYSGVFIIDSSNTVITPFRCSTPV